MRRSVRLFVIWALTVAVLLIFWHPPASSLEKYNSIISIVGLLFWFILMPIWITYSIVNGTFGKYKRSEKPITFYILAILCILGYAALTLCEFRDYRGDDSGAKHSWLQDICGQVALSDLLDGHRPTTQQAISGPTA